MKKRKMIKMKMKYLVIIGIAFAVFGCGTETKKEKAIESPKVTEKFSEVKEVTKEKFDTFFEKFGTDSVFQLSRISFPISYYTVDIEDNKEEYVYSKDDFWYIDFTEDSQAAERKVDAYEPVIKRDDDSKATYIRMGIDNGIRIEYYFEMNDKGEWYLVEIVDNSN
jgi:hypothetical protein